MVLIDFVIGISFILFAVFIFHNSVVRRKKRCLGCNTDCNFRK